MRDHRTAVTATILVLVALGLGGVVRSFVDDRLPPANRPTIPPSAQRSSSKPSPQTKRPSGPLIVALDRSIGSRSLPGIPAGARELEVSPDGKTIAFVVGREQTTIGMVGIDGGGLRIITDRFVVGHSPAWSPDGSQIAITTGAFGIAVMDADGSGLRQLTSGGHDPAWSPDGTRLAYWRKSGPGRFRPQIYTVPVQGGSRTHVGSGMQPAWSPDGIWIALIQPRHGLVIKHADGSGSIELLSPRGRTGPILPAWSPDGRTIAFVVPVWGPNNYGDGSVVDVGSGASHLVARRVANERPSWLPSGNALLLTRVPWG